MREFERRRKRRGKMGEFRNLQSKLFSSDEGARGTEPRNLIDGLGLCFVGCIKHDEIKKTEPNRTVLNETNFLVWFGFLTLNSMNWLNFDTLV